MIGQGVKRTLPHVYHKLCRIVSPYTRDGHFGHISAIHGHTSAIQGTNIFTTPTYPTSRSPDARGPTPRPEDRLPACPWTSPPACREGPRRTVPLPALFRSPRSAPGSLRDAPPPSGRRTLHPQGGRALRGQPSHLLPCGGGLPHPRASRSRPAETRSQGTSPMHSRDRRLRPVAAPGRPSTLLGRLAARDRPSVRRSTSPSEDGGARPRPGSKKRAPKSLASEASARFPSVEPEYEALRKAAMKGEASGPSPLGLGVFLLRGWMGWADALPTLLPVSPPLPVGGRLSAPARVHPDREVIHALAGLVLSYLGDRP